jgi:hypothetical protein
MSDIGNAIGDAIMAMVIVVIVVTAAVTAALIYGIPWLWALLKPLLHAWTA